MEVLLNQNCSIARSLPPSRPWLRNCRSWRWGKDGKLTELYKCWLVQTVSFQPPTWDHHTQLFFCRWQVKRLAIWVRVLGVSAWFAFRWPRKINLQMLPDAQMDTKMIIWKLSQVARSQSDTKKSMAKVERTKQLASDIQQLKYSVEIAALNAGVLRFLGVTVAFWTQKKTEAVHSINQMASQAKALKAQAVGRFLRGEKSSFFCGVVFLFNTCMVRNFDVSNPVSYWSNSEYTFAYRWVILYKWY